jgi:hypothetical protein
LIEGKISYGYIRSSRRVDFEGEFSTETTFIGWEVKIFSITPDSVQGFLRNQTYMSKVLTEIYGENILLS